MTQKEKQLLLIDLTARLPYGVKIDLGPIISEISVISKEEDGWHINPDFEDLPIEDVRPYLRPMSSMTEKEKEEYNSFSLGEDWITNKYMVIPAFDVLDWLNSHHFDYRGLIEKGLALEAKEGMYKTE